MVFDPHDAEEVTQEVLIKAITRLLNDNNQRCVAEDKAIQLQG
jgi:DNA-directed RNA polymerase specialized sigma24 family protein